MEYKDQPDFTHLLIDKFASQYVGNVSKNYWFLPDAVLKASTTYSANFQDMSKYIKMGYGSSPIYQTIVGIPNHYDMASGTIVKAITPQVQQIQGVHSFVHAQTWHGASVGSLSEALGAGAAH